MVTVTVMLRSVAPLLTRLVATRRMVVPGTGEQQVIVSKHTILVTTRTVEIVSMMLGVSGLVLPVSLQVSQR